MPPPARRRLFLILLLLPLLRQLRRHRRFHSPSIKLRRPRSMRPLSGCMAGCRCKASGNCVQDICGGYKCCRLCLNRLVRQFPQSTWKFCRKGAPVLHHGDARGHIFGTMRVRPPAVRGNLRMRCPSGIRAETGETGVRAELSGRDRQLVPVCSRSRHRGPTRAFGS
jgi:hypothetical protein